MVMSEKFSETEEGKKLIGKWNNNEPQHKHKFQNLSFSDIVDQAFQAGEKKAFDEAIEIIVFTPVLFDQNICELCYNIREILQNMLEKLKENTLMGTRREGNE